MSSDASATSSDAAFVSSDAAAMSSDAAAMSSDAGVVTSDAAAVCTGGCSYDHGDALCTAGTCVLGACNAGWADCDSDDSNGCEQSLSSPDHCATCTTVCALANASESCVASTCRVDTCDSGYFNCDNQDNNGCESQLDTLSDCGGCGTICELAQASESCATGTCTLGACDVGWGDCDLTDATGCERHLNTLSSCGTCDVACAPLNATGTCLTGQCAIAACNTGFTDCDGLASNGCELNSISCRTFALTVDATQVDATLLDFPVLVRVTDPLLSAARPDGFDIGFSADGGPTQLAFQIERWVQSTGELVAWVKLPSISAVTNTVFYMNYANGSTTDGSDAQSVWSSGYRAVYHMDYGGGAGTQRDSTVNANDAIPDTASCAAAAPVNEAAGIAGRALRFGADTCDRLLAPDNATLDFPNTSQVTMSAWVRMTTAPGYYQIVISKRVRNSGTTNYQYGFDRNTVEIGYFDGPDATAIVRSTPPTTANLNAWTHLVVMVDSTSATTGTCSFFKNGVLIATAPGCSLQPNSGPLWLGGLDQFTDEPLLGDLDEVHLSAGLRSEAWLKAEYDNQKPGSTFLTAAVN